MKQHVFLRLVAIGIFGLFFLGPRTAEATIFFFDDFSTDTTDAYTWYKEGGGLDGNSTEATITGETIFGTPIEGTDSVDIIKY